MSSNALISVIIPAYNAEKYLARCIASVCNQTYKKLEIIIINDGSSDDTEEVAKKFAKQDRRVVLLSQKNSGVSKARNVGLENSHGQYITFVDADDSIDEDFIEELLGKMEDGAIVCAKTCKNDSLHAGVYDPRKFIYKILKGKTMGVCWGKIYLASNIKNEHFVENINFMEDEIFLTKILSNGNIRKVIVTNNAKYLYNEDNCESSIRSLNSRNRINGYMDALTYLREIAGASFKKPINDKEIWLIWNELYMQYNAGRNPQIDKNIIKRMCNLRPIGVKSKFILWLSFDKDSNLSTNTFKLRKCLRKIKNIFSVL